MLFRSQGVGVADGGEETEYPGLHREIGEEAGQLTLVFRANGSDCQRGPIAKNDSRFTMRWVGRGHQDSMLGRKNHLGLSGRLSVTNWPLWARCGSSAGCQEVGESQLPSLLMRIGKGVPSAEVVARHDPAAPK